MRKWMGLVLSLVFVSLLIAGCEELPENQKSSSTANPGVVKATPIANPSKSYPVVGSAPTGYPGGNNYILKVIKADSTTVEVKATDIYKLTKVKITADGKSVEGYKLLDLLTQLKITSFNKLTLTDGKKSLNLVKADVDDSVILNIDPGLNFISGKLKSDQWMEFVTQLKVE